MAKPRDIDFSEPVIQNALVILREHLGPFVLVTKRTPETVYDVRVGCTKFRARFYLTKAYEEAGQVIALTPTRDEPPAAE